MGLIGNTGQAVKSGVVRKAAKLIEQSGRKVFLDPSVSQAAKGHGIVLADSVELARMCDLLMVIGGDGTMSISHRLSEMGMNIVGVPKTIDNDLVGQLLSGERAEFLVIDQQQHDIRPFQNGVQRQ